MTKYGRPVSVVPPSKTRAMLTWSIIARACRSASKRAMTWRLSMPGLMTLRATLRCTGCVCSAMKTVPMPPSPICCSSLYGPITVPAASLGEAAVGRLVPGTRAKAPSKRRGGGSVQEAVRGVVDRQQRLDPAEQGVVAAGRLPKVRLPGRPRRRSDGRR